MTNDFDAHYNVDVDRRGNIQNIAASEFNRRDALTRFAATAVASAAFLGGSPAFAADAQAATFSESPTSDSSIARMGYDGKGAPAPVEAAAAPPAEEATKEVAEPKKKDDFDGNEAGSVGGGNDVSWKKKVKVDPKITIPNLNLPVGQLISDEDVPKVAGGAVAFVVLASIASGGDEEEAKPNPLAKGGPPATPYGLSGGRNYWDGVDMTAAKQAGLVAPAPPTPPPEPEVDEPEPAEVKAAAVAPKEDKPKWKLDAPTPYGIQNNDGKNPFIKNVMEYCEGGKVTAPCTETIKGYLDEIAESGAVATKGEVEAVAGYLDALGSDSASSAIGGSPGAAFASYLDALSEGSAPPPSSAKAVKTYLDTLNGGSSAVEPMQQKPAPAAPMQPIAAAVAVVEPAAVSAPTSPDFSVYDNRLTNIEDRVTSLESKVDELPDKVFEKIEAWQTQHEGRLTAEVKKIVSALAPPPAPPAEPVAVVEAPTPVPEPEVVIPEPAPVVAAAPIVQATPLAAPVPERPSMPMAGSATTREYAKKGYGFGMGWKPGNPSKSTGGGYLDKMGP